MLAQLILREFRNFSNLDLTIPASGLVVIGDNGHGKTNLLEAIGYLGRLRSFRGARDADLVRFGASAFHTRAKLSPSAAWHTVGISYERTTKRKRAVLDGVDQLRLTIVLGALPSVVFSPNDIALIAGGPSERRRYLDALLAISSPAYLQALQGYRSALLQRNAVLKASQHNRVHKRDLEAQLSIWEPPLAEHGGIIVEARRRFVRERSARYSGLCAAIGERQDARMRYAGTGSQLAAAVSDSPMEHSEALARSLTQQRSADLRRGTTLIGPHRDDLVLTLGDRELRTFGSAGQQRSAAIALRLLELTTLREALGHTPLLLLDDPFAELDPARAARVLALFDEADASQVLLAVPRAEDIPGTWTRLVRCRICEGVLS